MPFSSMILSRTLSTGHAWLSKRVGLIDRSNQGDSTNLRRADTPRHAFPYLAVATGAPEIGHLRGIDSSNARGSPVVRPNFNRLVG
jgi:hypothetical protein